MSTLRVAVQDYLEMRRSLGFKLHDAGIGLLKFVSFLERQNASHITVALALQWAQESSSVQPVEWARRLSFVRGFARHWTATDPRTEVPPAGLLPYHPVRVRPYLYSEDEIQQLLQAALELESLQGMAGKTYYCLLGLLSVTGLRISEALHLRYEDVDLAEGILAVRGTKFGKSVSCPFIRRLRECSAITRRIVPNSWLDGPLLSFSYPDEEHGWNPAEFGERSTPSLNELDCGHRGRAMVHAFMIFAIASQSKP